MNGIVVVVLVFFGLAGILGGVAYFTYQRKLRRAKAVERGLKMVPILIHLPPPSSDAQGSGRDMREVMREKTAQAEVLYNLIAGTATEGFKSQFYGQRHVALELIAIEGVVHFFAAVPVAMVSVVQKAIQTAYPGARMEEVEDHNIFNQEGRLAATLGGEMVLREPSAYPIATYAKLERDPMEALLTTISALEKKDGVAVQIMLRPANPKWTKRSVAIADAKRKGHKGGLGFSAIELAQAAWKSPKAAHEEEMAKGGGISQLEQSEVEAIEEKTKHPGFEVLIRVLVSTGSVARSQQLLRDIATAFALFEAPGVNGFKFLPALDVQGLVTAFIFRFFPPELKGNILNSVELATLFHLPDSQFTPSASVVRQQSKQVDGPVQLPTVGLLFGHNEFRGVKKEIRLSPEDRRRHTYILGQTGTGKSTMLENLAVQDMLAGNGFAFIDPHGDSAEKLLALVPKERSEDIVYFNPADTQYPLGLNLFEFTDPSQKDFLVQETINMLYKLYDPGHTGIIGPRYEHWYRNAALTLMSDPNGSTFIEIPKVFTDTDYLKKKFKYLRDPTVIDFWTKEMGQTSDYHKSEMLGWFVSKFGAFQNNEMMRNIIGQTKSAFNIRDIMDKKKILIVNLSKGRIGELNSQLLGMIFVIKFQAAAMSRADVPEDQRADFALYVDEFQNFSTDSFASILSEARKYRLNLIVANQFIGQLSDQIRDAVFGNIGTIVAHRMGPEDAEFMVKQFAPVFDVSDLVNIPNYNAAMRLMIGGLPSQPFTLRNNAPIGNANLELGMAIKQLSAAKYGHAKAQVEADILDRFTGGKMANDPTAVGAPVPASSDAAAMAPVVSPAAVVSAAPVVSPEATVPPPLASAVTPTGLTPAPVKEGASVMPPVSAAAAAPSGAPVVNAAVLPAMAATPPPIGAPPVNLPAISSTDLAANAPMPPALQPVAAIIPEDNLGVGADQAVASAEPMSITESMPTTEPAFIPSGGGLPASMTAAGQPISVPAPEPAVSTLPDTSSQFTPPPIGAPPVDLPPLPAAAPMPIETSAVMPVPAVPVRTEAPESSPTTLSLRDITGGKPSVRRPDPASVPLFEPGVETPQAAGLLDSGEALAGDPYANIDVLGAAPPVAAEDQATKSTVVPAPMAVGEPLPGDPYAEIDVLGVAVEPPFVATSLTPSVPEPAPLAVQPVAASMAVPLVSVPRSPLQSQPEPLPAEPEPFDEASLPKPVASPPGPYLAPEPLPQPAVSMTDSDWAEPIPASPEPVVAQSDWSAGPEPAGAPAVRTRYDALETRAAVSAPQPMVVSPSAVEPVSELASISEPEPMIHFTDPGAAAVLDRPLIPETITPEMPDDNLVQGLPEGVRILPPTPSPAPPPMTVAVPPLPTVAAGPSTPVVPTVAPAVSPVALPVTAPVPLTQLAMTPPPIGAAPVAMPSPLPAPSVAELATQATEPVTTESEEAKIAQAAAAAPIPDMNLPLVKALEEVPVPPAPAPVSVSTPVAEAASLNKLESVAQMLEEDKAARVASTPMALPAAPGTTPSPQKPVGSEPEVVVPVKPVPAPTLPRESPTPMVAGSSQTVPHQSLTPAAQIEKAEHEIDNLLSTSLIHPDSTPNHRRLPEPVEPPREDESGADLELNTGRPSSRHGLPVPDHVAEHHGLKVIQPLEPIVPPKEEFAKELAALQSAAAVPVAAVPAVGGKPAVGGGDMPLPRPAARPQVLTPPKPPAVVPAPRPLAVKPAVAVVQPVPQPQPSSAPPLAAPAFDDVELPQAESLAAADVAKARAEQVEQAAPSVQPATVEPEVVAEVEAGKGESRSARRRRRRGGRGHERSAEASNEPSSEGQQMETKPAEAGLPAGESKPSESKPIAETQPPEEPKQSASQLTSVAEEKLPEKVESEAEAEHNRPSEAAAEAASMTGKLILPTQQKQSPESAQPKLEKPKKLAPGEVYVDEAGNVIIGE